MRDFGSWVRAVITYALLVIAAGWLVVVASTLGIPVVKSIDGSVFDQFQRSKDVLLVVTPLLTTVLGYWFGSAGRQEALNIATSARAEADMAQRRLVGVLGSSQEPGLLADATERDPKAFGLASRLEDGPKGPAETSEPVPAESRPRRKKSKI